MATRVPPIPPTATPIPAWFNQNRSPDPCIETDSGGPFVCGCTQCFPTRDLQLGSHEYSKLVEAVSSYANGPCGPIDRPRKTRAYREARATQWQKINWLVSADESRATLQNYARIFDDAFFFGALINRGRCEVDWDPCARKLQDMGIRKPSNIASFTSKSTKLTYRSPTRTPMRTSTAPSLYPYSELFSVSFVTRHLCSMVVNRS